MGCPLRMGASKTLASAPGTHLLHRKGSFPSHCRGSVRVQALTGAGLLISTLTAQNRSLRTDTWGCHLNHRTRAPAQTHESSAACSQLVLMHQGCNLGKPWSGPSSSARGDRKSERFAEAHVPRGWQDQDSNANKGYSRMAQEHHRQGLASFPAVYPDSMSLFHSFWSPCPQYHSESVPGVLEEAWLPRGTA